MLNLSTVNISFIIRELLFRHERIVIPGFGTFFIKNKPAEISKTTLKLTPPSKTIVFDGNLRTGDPQLVLSVRKKLGLSETAAGEAIMKFVHNLEEQIRKDEKAEIEGLGYVNKVKSGGYTFKPFPDAEKLTGGFTLPVLEIPEPRHPLKPQPVTEVPARTIRRVRWQIPAAIFVSLVALLAAVYFTGLLGRHSGEKEAATHAAVNEDPDRLVFGKRENADDTLQQRVTRELDERTAPENALQYEEPAKPAPDKVLPAAETAPPSKAQVPRSGYYHIISGSFTLQENAERQQSQLLKKGLEPVLLPPRGKYYMVSLGAYETQSQAAEALKAMRVAFGLELWVMKIK
jgi:nucleoid DNA-binding protein